MDLLNKFLNIFSSKYAKVIIGVIFVLGLVWFLFRSKPIPTEIVKVQKGTYEDFFEEEGITRVKEKFTMYSPVSGILRRVELHAGDTVKKGQKLFFVDWDFLREVKSPIDGEILKVIRESAGPVMMQEPIMEIGNIRELEIVAEVLTQDAVKIHKGDSVQITGWGGEVINGKVRLIEPSAFTKISSLGVEEQRIKVLIDFNPPEKMGEAFKVLCKIVSEKLPGRTLVPSSALFRDGENWALFTVEKGKAKKTQVKVESRNNSFASVISGVTEGMEVILYPSENVRDGVKVR